jgi:Gas vesicle synthesis protein GvpL/GvpF
MLHLYGIVELDVSCAGVGLAGEPLVPIPCGDVVAVASEHSRPFGQAPSEQELWEHEGVLEALLDTGSVLPVRFGVSFAHREAVRAELQPRSAQLEAALAHVRDRVELSVRLLERANAPRPSVGEIPSDAGPGVRYLSERLEQRRDASRKLDTVLSRLAPRAVAERSHLLPRAGALAVAAFLVERAAVDDFRQEVLELERELADVVLVCTGPWPPYNFVDGPLRGPA